MEDNYFVMPCSLSKDDFLIAVLINPKDFLSCCRGIDKPDTH